MKIENDSDLLVRINFEFVVIITMSDHDCKVIITWHDASVAMLVAATTKYFTCFFYVQAVT